MIAPNTLLLLQQTQGNAFVQRLLHKQRPAVHRAVLTGPSVSHTPAEIRAMTLNALYQFAQDQVDWFNTKDISNVQRWQFRGLLTFANREGILSGCGDMKVSDLLATGIVTKGGQINPAVARPLEDYGKAVSNDIDTVEIQTPAPDPPTALKWGRALRQLMGALAGSTLKDTMHQARFEELLTRNLLNDFIHYVRVCHPRIEAEKEESKADDIASYLAMRNEGRDPVFYSGTSLRGHVHNFHRFERAALDALVTHYNDRNLPNARRKPLTLILHTAKDHNAAFHRDPNLTTVITDSAINTLMVEGKETLADVSGELQPLARAYGKDKKIDQVMIAGHGNARVIELGASEDVNLDTNAGESNKLFDEILRNMADDPAIAPHRRIVFNACLTNSNAVTMPLTGAKMTDQQKEVRDFISANSALATYLQSRARAQGLTNIDVRGANGSFGQVELIDSTDGLTIISKPDPAAGDPGDPSIAAAKQEYVKTGTEPQGVLRAALEGWSGFNQPDAEVSRQETLKAMSDRAKTAAADYDDAIIHSLFNLITTRYPKDGEMIRLFADVAGAMAELRFEGKECRVSYLVGAGLGPGGAIPSDVVKRIFADVSPMTGGIPKAKLVIDQVWMRHDGAKRADFMSDLASFNCQTAADFIDVPFITPELKHLLPNGASATREQLLVAFRVIDTDQTQADARTFLLDAVGSGNRRFPAALGVDAILAGRPSQQVILEDLGLVPSSTGGASAGGDQQANLDLDGDGVNETYVEPLPGARGTSAGRSVPTFDHPDTSAAHVRNLWLGQPLYLIGQTGDFYAIQNPWSARQTIFVEKANVNRS